MLQWSSKSHNALMALQWRSITIYLGSFSGLASVKNLGLKNWSGKRYNILGMLQSSGKHYNAPVALEWSGKRYNFLSGHWSSNRNNF